MGENIKLSLNKVEESFNKDFSLEKIVNRFEGLSFEILKLIQTIYQMERELNTQFHFRPKVGVL